MKNADEEVRFPFCFGFSSITSFSSVNRGEGEVQCRDRTSKSQEHRSAICWSARLGQKPKPAQEPTSGYLIKSLPLDAGYRVEAIELANSTFEDVVRRIEPDNPRLMRKLWNASEYVDNHHLRDDMLPIDSKYALSLIEAFLVHYVIGLATKADEMAFEKD